MTAAKAAGGVREQEQPGEGPGTASAAMGMATISLCEFWDDTNIPNSSSEEHHFLTVTNLVESLNEAERGEKLCLQGEMQEFPTGNTEGNKPWESWE